MKKILIAGVASVVCLIVFISIIDSPTKNKSIETKKIEIENDLITEDLLSSPIKVTQVSQISFVELNPSERENDYFGKPLDFDYDIESFYLTGFGKLTSKKEFVFLYKDGSSSNLFIGKNENGVSSNISLIKDKFGGHQRIEISFTDIKSSIPSQVFQSVEKFMSTFCNEPCITAVKNEIQVMFEIKEGFLLTRCFNTTLGTVYIYANNSRPDQLNGTIQVGIEALEYLRRNGRKMSPAIKTWIDGKEM